MSWIQKLYDTYEHAQALDVSDQDVMPISHTLQNAHINIVIDDDGNFKRARVLEKTKVVLPATEASAGRSGKEPPPHPLSDKLQYVAQDYVVYGGNKKPFFEGYAKQLGEWVHSAYTHPKALAVFNYVSKGTVIHDLVAEKVCYVDKNEVLLSQWLEESEAPLLFKVLPKDKGKLDQGNALVCWSVEIEGQSLSNTWQDKSLQDAWVQYDINRGGATSFCCVTGNETVAALNHPAKLRHTGDKAKLISANDSSGYTFRGRFLDAQQAVSVGFEVTQKAHNALRWLLSRQGYRNGDHVTVSWAVSGAQVPQPFSDPNEWGSEIDDLSVVEKVFPVENVLNHSVDLGLSFANNFKKKLAGYCSGKSLELTDSIVVMSLDSATPGRMAISYYRDFRPTEYLDNLQQWHLDFAWWQRASKDKKDHGYQDWYLCAPSLWAILQAVYGDIIKSNDALKKNLAERLLPTIIEKRDFPIDIQRRAIQRATNRQSYKQDEQWQWEQNLGVACALYRGYYQRHPDIKKRRTYQMALETENHSRDYLYGRLLAIAENIEQFALDKAGEKRTTTAGRLMQRFADRPFSTWKNIELALQPYIQRLQNSSGGFVVDRKQKLDEVQSLFNSEEFIQDKALSGEFLLGFHCQRLVLRKKNETVNNEEVKEGSES